MLNRAPSLGRLTLALLCLAVLLGLFFVVRCTHVAATRSAPAKALDAPQLAHLTMLNSSDCEWRIGIRPTAGGDTHVWKVQLGKSLEVGLAGGEYVVEQTMAIESARPAAARRFSVQLEAGQYYRWRLMTLLSGAGVDAPASAASKDGHE